MNTVRHRPQVVRSDGETGEGFAITYQAVCRGCGLAGEAYYIPRPAEQERDAHIAEVAAPEGERCQRPREHRMKKWDACPLCAAQLPLFEDWEVSA